MKKTLSLLLIMLGTAFLIAAIAFWIESILSSEPQSVGRLLRDFIALILGIISSFLGWIDLFKEEKPAEAATSNDAKGETSQFSTDDHASDIQSETYIENQIIERPEDEISFTAMYPTVGSVQRWHTLLVYTHLSSVVEEVRKDAKRFHDQLPSPKEVITSSSTRIARGTEITIVPSGGGLIFNPEKVSFRWLEDYHRADFHFHVDNSLVNDAARGEINICVGPLIVGTLKLAMLINDAETHGVADHVEQGEMYHQDDIFVSYSHKDSSVVLACKKAYQALGFNVLIDIDTLRAGQVWSEELMKMIDRANIFQLFWSQNSSESKYCQSEWQYALKQKRNEGFIRPVYWRLPMPTPPIELSHIHFDFIELENSEE